MKPDTVQADLRDAEVSLLSAYRSTDWDEHEARDGILRAMDHLRYAMRFADRTRARP